MATQYAEPPASLSYGDGFNTVPNGMLWRLRKIQGMTKETIKITPTSGQGSYPNSSKITVSLPMNSMFDYASLEGNFYARTNHAGATAGGPGNYVRTRYFPRNMQSLIESIDVKVGGKSIQQISQYGYIFNILNDYQCGNDAY